MTARKTFRRVPLRRAEELKSSLHAERCRQSHDVTWSWTDVQQNARRLGFVFSPAPTQPTDAAPTPPASPTLTTPSHKDPLNKTNVMAQLKLHAKLKLHHAHTWECQTDQGRTVRAHGRLGRLFVTRPGALHDHESRIALAARPDRCCALRPDL